MPDVQSLVLKVTEEAKSKCNANDVYSPGCDGDSTLASIMKSLWIFKTKAVVSCRL